MNGIRTSADPLNREPRSRQATHVDTILMSPALEKVLVSPEFVNPEKLSDVFKVAKEQVIVERSQEPMITALKGWSDDVF